MAIKKLTQPAIADTMLLSDRQQKSRGIPIVDSRNLRMVARYYVYTVLMEIKHDVAVKAMKMEFFLKEKTINKIIASREPELKEMCSAKRTIEWFKEQKEWTHVAWDYNPSKQ